MTVESELPTVAPGERAWVACVDAPLEVGLATSWVVDPRCGAVVTFAGTVRDHAGDRRGVHQLEYEAYEEQVTGVLEAIAADGLERYPGAGRLVIWHRVGALAVTDVAVVVAVSTPHRDDAFSAARWMIDEVKARAPIWKREHHDGGIDWGRCDHNHGPAAEAAPVTVGERSL